MGTWGVEIFEDDLAQDVRAFYESARAVDSFENAAQATLSRFKLELSDEISIPIVYLALASILMDEGHIVKDISDKCHRIINSGLGLDIWEPGSKLHSDRQKVYQKFLKRLSTKPKARPAVRIRGNSLLGMIVIPPSCVDSIVSVSGGGPYLLLPAAAAGANAITAQAVALAEIH